MHIRHILQGALLAGTMAVGCAPTGGTTGAVLGGSTGVTNGGGTTSTVGAGGSSTSNATQGGGPTAGGSGNSVGGTSTAGNSPTGGSVATGSSQATGGANNPTTGGSKATGGSSAKNTGGSATAGGTTNSGGGDAPTGGTDAAGGTSAAVTCSNTDMSIIPIDATGWVDKACNACGIQGAFYWYADDNTKASLKCNGSACVKDTPPFQTASPGPGMCIAGTATGATTDWGAGIGLSLNDSGGTNSVKGSFNGTTAACGNITGFDVTLTGNTNGMPVRIGFTNTGDGTTVAPFIPVGDPAGTTLALSGSTQVVIKNATIPADWKSSDPSPADPANMYDVQIQVAADQATAGKAFNLCVTSIKPVINGGSGGGTSTGCKTNSVGTISTNTGAQALGSNYGYQNNVNNLGSGSQSVTGYYGSSCAAMTVTTSGITSSNNSPASYPSIVDGWHWGSWNGSYTKSGAKTLSALSSVTSSWSFTPPAGQKWDVSYDMWVASSTGISAPDGSTLEVMVWLDYATGTTTNPIGSKLTNSITVGGTTWEIWYGQTGSWHTVTYRRTPGTGAVTSLDLLAFLKDAVTHGTGTTSWYLLSVEAGFELFNATSGGSIDSYSVTIN